MSQSIVVIGGGLAYRGCRDHAILRRYEDELGLEIDWKDFSARKAH